jgi:hypothetical protein
VETLAGLLPVSRELLLYGVEDCLIDDGGMIRPVWRADYDLLCAGMTDAVTCSVDVLTVLGFMKAVHTEIYVVVENPADYA